MVKGMPDREVAHNSSDFQYHNAIICSNEFLQSLPKISFLKSQTETTDGKLGYKTTSVVCLR